MAISALPGGRCATADVDLEALADGYGHRLPSAATYGHAAAAVDGMRPGGWLLDIGAGRGEHAAVWAGRGHRAVSLDPGIAMSAKAAGQRGVIAMRGRSQQLPFRDSSLALVYFHLSIHYGDWRRAIAEAARVLHRGGRCVVWTLGSRHHRASMLARWFPSVPRIDARRFPEPGEIARQLEGAGLSVDVGREVEAVHRSAGDWAAAVRAGFVSTLQLLDPAELEAGLAAFALAHPDPEETISYELKWDWIRGTQSAP